MWRWPRNLLLVLMVSGCQPGPDTVMDDYLTRLERVLGTERPPLPQTPPDRPSRARFQLAPSPTVSLLTPLSLKPCGVLPLIAEHNAQLGRVAAPSQQLLYHHEIGHRLHHCDPHSLDHDGQALRTRLLADKARLLQQQSARLFLLSDELWFNLGADGAGWRFGDLAAVEQSLQRLARTRQALQQWDTPLDGAERLETDLAILHHGQLPRALHRSMLAATQTLKQATQMLARADTLSCHSEAMTILPNVLSAIYGDRVQPLLSQVQQADRRLTPPLRALLAPWPDDPYFDYYLGDQPGQLRHAFYQSIQQHTQAWQALLRRCDRSPAAGRG